MSEEKLQSRIRREQIAEAALALVASQGLRRLSIAAVARRVGLVPSGIYRHFKSKDEMLAAALDLLEKRLLDNVRAARQKTADPLEQLEGILKRHVRLIREGRAIPRIVFSDDVHSGHPQRKQRAQRILERYLEQIGECVREGQRQGRIRPDLSPETVGMLFFGLIVPAVIRWHLSDGGFDVTRHAKQAWPLFLKAVTP